MKQNIQVPLGKKFSEMPKEFRKTAHKYFYKILPTMSREFKAVTQLGPETNLEAFEELIEEGGVRFLPEELYGYKVMLFNLITNRYEDITFLKEELEGDEQDENQGY